MKIIISESQAIRLLKESYGNQEYIDLLLDKISSEGISALTPRERNDLEKMSRGEDIEFDDQDKKKTTEPSRDNQHFRNVDEIREMFMKSIPRDVTVNYNGKSWELNKHVDPSGDYEILILSQGLATVIEIDPFTTKDTFTVATTFSNFDIYVNDSIKSQDDLKKFVKDFVQIDLKKIIKHIESEE